MKVFKIPKKNGTFRTIYAPEPELKAQLQTMLPEIMEEAMYEDTHKVQHGFTAGRSPVTNALAHAGWQYTLSFDLADFFDSVVPEMFERTMTTPNSDCFYDGAARQGLPTSPALANIAAAPMDDAIMELNAKGRFGQLFVYTRYADDLTFSFNLEHIGKMLLREIPRIVEAHGFKINPRKTHLQCAKAGRRIITGVAVEGAKVFPTRELKRRLRAARHQASCGLRRRNLAKLIARQHEKQRKEGIKIPLHSLHMGHLKGLEEWSKLRLPHAARTKPPVNPLTQSHPVQTQQPLTRPVVQVYGRAYSRKFVL